MALTFDLCFISPQPDTSLQSEISDMGLVRRVVCSSRLPVEGWPGWVDSARRFSK